MLLKIARKRGTLLVSASLFCVLTACSPNPLKTVKPDKAARFLVHASRETEKKMKLTDRQDLFGANYYPNCMNEKEDKALCKKLYQGMVEYAKTIKKFSSLSLSDLTDQAVFSMLEDDYERHRFNGG